MNTVACKIGIALIVACFSLGTITCDSMYEYDFYVQNVSVRNIKAIVQIQTQQGRYAIDTFPIPPDSSALIYRDENWGQIRNIAAPSDSIPAYTNIGSLQISIKNSSQKDTVIYNQNPLNFSLWRQSGVVTGPGKSQYSFIVDSTIIPDSLGGN